MPPCLQAAVCLDELFQISQIFGLDFGVLGPISDVYVRM